MVTRKISGGNVVGLRIRRLLFILEPFHGRMAFLRAGLMLIVGVYTRMAG